MMKFFTLFLVLLSLNTHASSSCEIEFSQPKICAELIWLDGPNLDTTSQFRVRFWSKSDPAQMNIKIPFDLNMYSWMVMDNGHSHGGPKFHVQKISNEEYQVDDARFFLGGMRGYWQIILELKDNGSLIEKKGVRVVL